MRRAASLLLFCAVGLSGQDPYRLAPQNYKLEFDNAYVRLSRVIYQPGDKIPVHDHPAWNTVYIYLTDGGEVLYGHQQFEGAKRPAVKAGAVRFARANRETHTTTYLGDQPSEYFRVELKTEVPEFVTNARIAATSSTAIDNPQVRIERLSCAAHCPPADWHSVVVSIDDRSGRYLPPGAAVPTGTNLIRVILKTGPRP
jgi:hypothetical protein